MSPSPAALRERLTARGVVLHAPVTIAPDVDPERIAPGCELFPGSRIAGAATAIGPDCRIGHEGPAVLIDCQLGQRVRVASGFAQNAVFLDDVKIGANAHIRPGTVLEEQASCAHCVGLKQTVLMPWVTLGSLVNFCDCLMAGGTDARDHGEVGSSFVHFNFTPRGDKATASLIGDVPRGVLLDQPPIFLGGQGGLVGPIRIAYGTVVAAGSILRRDVLEPGRLVRGEPDTGPAGAVAYNRQAYGRIDRITRMTFAYVGNLHALAAWYRHVRMPFATNAPFTTACYEGVLRQLEGIARERCKQLNRVAEAVSAQAECDDSHRRLRALQPRLPTLLALPATSPPPPARLRDALDADAESHIARVQALTPPARQAAVNWLESIVNTVNREMALT